MTGKCSLGLGDAGPFRARAFAFQLGSHTSSLVSQGAGPCHMQGRGRSARARCPPIRRLWEGLRGVA